jgi:hypothetical protein
MMRLKFSGFNATSKRIDNFEIGISDGCSCFEPDENSKQETIDLKRIHCTFDCFYYTSANKKKVFYFDFEKKIFKRLMQSSNNNSNSSSDQSILISCCSDTNYFWCLIKKKFQFDEKKCISQFELCQYSNKHLIDQISLDEHLFKSIDDLDELFVLSTDINFYLFHNSKEGLKCIFELKSSNDLSIEKLSLEKNLNESAISSISLNKILIKEKIKQASSGNEHILLLTESNQIYSFGLGTKGQLGHGSIDNHYEPKLIDSIDNVLTISANGWHSAAITANGECYVWGSNVNSQLGIESDQVFVTKPSKIEFLDEPTAGIGRIIKQISLGSRHSALIDENKCTYTFGWNKYLQTFHQTWINDAENEICEPKELLEFRKSTFGVICGKWYTLLIHQRT